MLVVLLKPCSSVYPSHRFRVTSAYISKRTGLHSKGMVMTIEPTSPVVDEMVQVRRGGVHGPLSIADTSKA